MHQPLKTADVRPLGLLIPGIVGKPRKVEHYGNSCVAPDENIIRQALVQQTNGLLQVLVRCVAERLPCLVIHHSGRAEQN